MTQSRTILLQDPLEYLIFNGENITLIVESTHHIPALIIDSSENLLFVQVTEQDAGLCLDYVVGNNVRIICDYRSQRLEFDVNVKRYDAKTNIIETAIPHQGQLSNYRHWERTNFELGQNPSLCAEIEIDTILGHRIIKSNQFFEFSYKAISVFVDRSQGLIVPNDIVEKITIKSKKKTIFYATGVVSRISKSDEHDDKLFVVIQLNDPNVKPVLDISPNKRQSDRYIFEKTTDAFIEFTHPFSLSKKVTKILDISNSGISIAMQGSKYAMPPGLLIDNVSMQLPLSARLDIMLRVKGFAQEQGAEEGLKVCMEFVNATPELVKEVTNFVQHKLSCNLQDATSDDIEELWYFYFETRFFYKSKRQQLQNNAVTIKDTFKKLLETNTPLIKKILYKEDGVIKGNVTAIKVFDHSLMVQHLNALKTNSGSAAKEVVRGITSYFMDGKANNASGNRYICFYFRPNNLYPALVFGEAAKLIDNPDICWTYTYQFSLPADSYDYIQDKDIDVYEASVQDLADLETTLIRNDEFNIIRLEGLARETLTNMTITETYKDIGLYRHRRVFVAKDGDTGKRVYAVCCYASAGLNFSELTNSIKLYETQESSRSTQKLINAVCDYALRSYEETAVQNPCLLLKPEQPVPNSFVLHKNYTLFALDIRHTKQFKIATEHVFANFKQFVREKSASSKH